MIEIAPSINVAEFAEVVRRIRVAERHARIIHLDVSDGTFTPHVVWHNARDLDGFETPAKLEVHLMVAEPEKKVEEWLIPQIFRVIFHAEAAQDAPALIERCHSASKEVGVSIRPDTPWETLMPYGRTVDLLQTLAVSPGPSGQTFDPRTIEKIKNLRAQFPYTLIEVDGGVGGQGVAKSCVDAGATILVEGASLFDREISFEKAYEDAHHELLGHE